MDAPPVQYARTSDGVNIAYLDLGAGEPIVFASNLYGDAHFYRSIEVEAFGLNRFIHRLLDDGRRVILYDVRGTGASDRNVERLDLEARVNDLEAVIGALGLRRFALCGPDMGGAPAISYAARNAEAVSRLLLLEPWASGARKLALTPTKLIGSMAPAPGEEWRVRAHAVAGIVLGFQDREAENRMALAIEEATSPDQFAAFYRATAEIDVTGLLPQVTVPALVVHLTDAFMGSLELARDVASGLGDARFLVTDRASYWPAVRDFLAEGREGNSVRPPARPVASLGLSRRQTEVLRLIALGRTNREIADELVLSLRTVERHVADLYTRLGVRNRAEAVAIGVGVDAAVEP